MANINDLYKAYGAKNKNEYIKKVVAEEDAVVGLTALTDNSGGTASSTLADVPGTYTEALHANHTASLAKKVNDIIAALNT